MNETELLNVLMIEVHRLIADAAAKTSEKLGRPIPDEARAGFLSAEDVSYLKENGGKDLNHPAFIKSMAAAAAKSEVLSYPPEDVLSSEELKALETLALSASERSAIQKLMAEACASAFFRFFCLLDAVADPEMQEVEEWSGVRLEHPRSEGPMIHDEFYEKYWDYMKARSS